MTSIFKFFLFCMCLALTACTTLHNQSLPDQTMPRYAAKDTRCCAALNTLGYSQLSFGRPISFILDKSSSVIQVHNGTSYAQSFLLPHHPNGVLLEITSEIHLPNGLLSNRQVLYPIVTLLDHDFHPIANIDNAPLHFDKPFFFGGSIGVTIQISRQLNHAKYVLIHTGPEKLNYSLHNGEPLEIVKDSGFKSIFYGATTRSNRKIPFSSSGKLKIQAYPLY